MGLWSQSRLDAISTLPNCLKNWTACGEQRTDFKAHPALLSHITNAKPTSRVGLEWAEKKSSAGSRGAASWWIVSERNTICGLSLKEILPACHTIGVKLWSSLSHLQQWRPCPLCGINKWTGWGMMMPRCGSLSVNLAEMNLENSFALFYCIWDWQLASDALAGEVDSTCWSTGTLNHFGL